MKNYTWNDVSIGQFEEIESILKMNTNDTIKKIDILSVMTGVDSDVYFDMNLVELNNELNRINDILHLKPKMEVIQDRYIIDGNIYKMLMSPQKMTAGQFIDYQSIIENNPSDMSAIVSVFLTPLGSKYGQDYDVIEFRKLLKEKFSVTKYMGIGFFFLKASNILQINTLSYSIVKLKKELKKTKIKKDQNTIKMAIDKIQKAINHLRYGTLQ